MTYSRNFLLSLACCALAVLLVGCSSTRVDALWRNPETPAPSIRGPVLIVGVARDEALRRIHEDAMAEKLAQQAVRAIPSYTVLPESLDDASNDRLVAAAREAGATRVLVSMIADRQLAERLDVPGDPRGWRYAGLPPQADRRFVVRTTLLEVATGKMVWAARTQTRNLGSVKREVLDFAAAIVEALRADRVV